MRKVILKDGTIITGCTDSTTVDRVFALRGTYTEAGAVLDLITPENASVIKVYDENDQLITSGGDLILLPDIRSEKTDDGVIVSFGVRRKTEIEVMKDEISELQDVVIGE